MSDSLHKMCKQIAIVFFVVIATVCIVAPYSNASAAIQDYGKHVTYNAETETLVFSCDYFDPSDLTRKLDQKLVAPPVWSGYKAKHIVIDESMRSARNTSTAWWFASLSQVEDIQNFGILDLSETDDMTSMFEGMTSLKRIDLSPFSKATDLKVLDKAFSGCSSLEKVDLSPLHLEKVTSMNGMFENCAALSSAPLVEGRLPVMQSMAGVFKNCTSLTQLDFTNVVIPSAVGMAALFDGCTHLRSVVLPSASNVSNLENLFANCTNLTDIDFSHCKTAEASSMRQMFYECSSLITVDLSALDATNVKDMTSMFAFCKHLENLDMSHFTTEKLENTSRMFECCYRLQQLNLSGLNTASVTNMSGMFIHCYGLYALDVSSFNTENVTDMSNMFFHCYSLVDLDLSSFDTKNVTTMQSIFDHCSSIHTLNISSFDTSALTTSASQDMFDGCSPLKILVSPSLASSSGLSFTKGTYFLFSDASCTPASNVAMQTFNGESGELDTLFSVHPNVVAICVPDNMPLARELTYETNAEEAPFPQAITKDGSLVVKSVREGYIRTAPLPLPKNGDYFVTWDFKDSAVALPEITPDEASVFVASWF